MLLLLTHFFVLTVLRRVSRADMKTMMAVSFCQIPG
jgi:hypothetical protein